jgi:formate dehydrogenase major subunit
MDQIREEVAKWTPEEVERVTGVPGSQMKRVARTMANNRPGTVIWCMGGTQHTNGNNNTRAYCVLQLALGNMGTSGGGTNIFRGHDNVQGATDLGVLSHTLPGYYGLSAGAWAALGARLGGRRDWLTGQFADEARLMQTTTGIPVSRWIDGVLEDKANMDQPDNVRAMVCWGHAPNSQTRGRNEEGHGEAGHAGRDRPVPDGRGVMHDRKDGVYLLPATTQFETYGSVTASNRSIQWREKVIDPLFESKTDHEIMACFARKFGFETASSSNIAEGTEPLIEDITREFNRGMWTIGYTGQSPERIKLHMANQHTFDKTTLQANGRAGDGDYYGLPWPCWGTAEMKHPGTPNLYDTSKPVAEGGLCFRARFGVERRRRQPAGGQRPTGRFGDQGRAIPNSPWPC